MSILISYLAVGVFVLLFVIAHDLLSKNGTPQPFDEQCESLDTEKNTLWNRFLTYVVAPILVVVLVIAGWPVALVMQAREMLAGKARPGAVPERMFAVTQDQLLRKMSIAEIELRERVVDPMAAVPDLPFGHLHGAWKTFADCLEAEDSIWSFTACWRPSWGPDELRAGYVVLRDGVIGRHFLTSWRPLDES